VSAAGATSLLWTSSGDLLAYGAGIGRLDVETGAWLDHRCGWSFGRTDTSPPFIGGETEICEEP